MLVFVLADVIAIAKDIANEINGRLEASKNLGLYCRDLRALVMQVVDLMSTLPENTSVESGVKATNDLLRDILDFIKKDEDYAETAGCCSLFVHAKDYAAEVNRYEERMRKQVALLTQLVTIKSVQDSVAGIITNKDARQFWISNFGDKDRSVPWRLMVDAFESRFNINNEDHLEEIKSVLLEHQDLSNSKGFGDLKVSVFKFDSTFKEGTVRETVSSFVSEAKDTKRAWHIIVRDPETKVELDVDAGFVLIPDAGSLSTVRSSIVAELADDEDLPEELEWLSQGKGNFHFYLEDGKSRVKKNQEPQIKDGKKIDTACLVPDKEGQKAIEEQISNGTIIKGYSRIKENDNIVVETAPSKAGEKSTMQGFRVVSTSNKVGPAPAEADEAVLDDGMMNMAAARKAAKKETAEGIQIADVLTDDDLMHQFKKVLKKMNIDEVNADFLQRLNQGTFSDQQTLDDMGDAKGLLASNEPTADAKSAHDQVESMQKEIMQNLSSEAMDALKKSLEKAPRTKMGRGKGKKIAIIGGGTGGTTATGAIHQLLPDASVTLIDEKEYHEMTPMIPSCMVQEDKWSDASMPHSGYLRQGKDQLVIGKVIALNANHVVVGANKQVVPFDYCINFSGSRYTSDIKTNNITMTHRKERMAKERENISKCKEVVCIGGGLVGVEIACDIKDEFPDKPVTLIHRGNTLMSRQVDAHAILMEYLTKKGIKVKLNCEGKSYQMDEDDKGYFPIVKTAGGDDVRAPEQTGGLESVDDHDEQRLYIDGTRVYWCTGYTANTAHIKAGPFKDCIDDHGFIMCDDFLRVGGSETIFSGGDCVASKHFVNAERTAHYAALHAISCVTNIKNAVEGEPLQPFQPNPLQASNMLIVELGATDALMVVPANYDPMLSFFGEQEPAVQAILKPLTHPPPNSVPTRIGLVPGGGLFKSGFMAGMLTNMRGGPEGMKAFIDMEMGVIGMANVWTDKKN